MSKANRTCYCCGSKYYYCPSCHNERRDPKVYTMFDSELCKEIFNTLVNESMENITTLECKEKLVKLGVNKNTVLKDSIREHVNRVMNYKKDTVIKNDTTETVIKDEHQPEDEKNTTIKIRTKKSSLKNKENSEAD